MTGSDGGKLNMSKKLMILILGVVVLFIGMMGAGFFILWSKLPASAPAAVSPEGQHAESNQEEQGLGPLYSLGTLIVNLADEGGKRYLRVSIEMELSDKTLQEQLEKRLPQIRDTILMILPTKTYKDINTTEGKQALRTQIISELNKYFSTGSITNLYFTEFVVQ
jgi:flagellar FliL protein